MVTKKTYNAQMVLESHTSAKVQEIGCTKKLTNFGVHIGGEKKKKAKHEKA